VEENSMKHLLRAVMVALATLLVCVPAITLAQTPPATPGAPGVPTTPGAPAAPITPGAPGAPIAPGVPTPPGAPTLGQPGASPATPGGSVDSNVKSNLGGAASPGKPVTSDVCKDGGWQKFGFKGQGECVGSFTSGGKR
jgi:hypothetical protein